MRNWMLTFFVLTILTGLVGFTQLAIMIAQFSHTVFYIFIVLFALSVIYYLIKKQPAAINTSLIFFAVAAITGILAFTNLTDAMVYIAKLLFYIFLVLFILSLVMHFTRKKVL